jgi:hypothetical protein
MSAAWLDARDDECLTGYHILDGVERDKEILVALASHSRTCPNLEIAAHAIEEAAGASDRAIVRQLEAGSRDIPVRRDVGPHLAHDPDLLPVARVDIHVTSDAGSVDIGLK